jgi:hypothetical protein
MEVKIAVLVEERRLDPLGGPIVTLKGGEVATRRGVD